MEDSLDAQALVGRISVLDMATWLAFEGAGPTIPYRRHRRCLAESGDIIFQLVNSVVGFGGLLFVIARGDLDLSLVGP